MGVESPHFWEKHPSLDPFPSYPGRRAETPPTPPKPPTKSANSEAWIPCLPWNSAIAWVPNFRPWICPIRVLTGEKKRVWICIWYTHEQKYRHHVLNLWVHSCPSIYRWICLLIWWSTYWFLCIYVLNTQHVGIYRDMIVWYYHIIGLADGSPRAIEYKRKISDPKSPQINREMYSFLPDPWKGQFSWNWKSLISEIPHQVDQIEPSILLKLF